jgi:ferrous iron transport protein B
MKTIALVGNPNSGKSSVFNHLTGLHQKVANFPGVTVEKKSGKCQLPNGEEVLLIDFPGAYSLYPSSQDERAVLDVFSNPADENFPDAVVYIADITNLEKHFLLLTQIMDLGIPTLLALNMTDLAEKGGVILDEQRLSNATAIPILKISGRHGDNLDKLQQSIVDLLQQERNTTSGVSFYQFSQEEQDTADRLKSQLGIANPYQALLLAHHFEKLPHLSTDEKARIAGIVQATGFQDLPQQINETMQRYGAFSPIIADSLRKDSNSQTLTDKLDALLTHRVWAPFIFFVVLFFLFQAIYALAEFPMSWIENGFAALSGAIAEHLSASWLTDLLTDGLVAGLGGIVVFIPQIAILFFLISILEEVGYMARAVFIFDKPMQQFGLNGRSVVALVSGGACAIPAIMSTRTISNWKERLLTIMVTPMISCSARIPVYTVLIGFVVPPDTVWGFLNLQGVAFMGFYLLGIGGALVSALIFRAIIRSREPSWLIMELPPYRLPVWKNVWQTVYEKVTTFITEAGKVIIVISILLWALASYGPAETMKAAEAEAATQAQAAALDETATADLIAARKIEASYAGHLGKFIEPVIRPLGFDWKIGIALITSFAAREVFVSTMATLYSIGSSDDESTLREKLATIRRPETGQLVYTPATALSLLVFYVFAMQCMSTLAVVRKETGTWKWAFFQFAYMSAFAYLGSLLVYQILG